jgi:hypothetical protein
MVHALERTMKISPDIVTAMDEMVLDYHRRQATLDDDRAYQIALPVFKESVSHFAKGSGDIYDVTKMLLRSLMDKGFSKDAVLQMRPYLARFIDDVRSGREKLHSVSSEGNETAKACASSEKSSESGGNNQEQIEVLASDFVDAIARLPKMQREPRSATGIIPADTILSPGKEGVYIETPAASALVFASRPWIVRVSVNSRKLVKAARHLEKLGAKTKGSTFHIFTHGGDFCLKFKTTTMRLPLLVGRPS